MRTYIFGVLTGLLLSGSAVWAVDNGFMSQQYRDMLLQQQQFQNFNQQLDREQRQFQFKSNPCD